MPKKDWKTEPGTKKFNFRDQELVMDMRPLKRRKRVGRKERNVPYSQSKIH